MDYNISKIMNNFTMSFYSNQEYQGKIIYNYDLENKLGFIIYIYVKEEFRKQNLSSLFYDAWEKEIKKLGINSIKLTAKEEMSKYGKLRSLYKSWGFQEFGRDSIYSEDDYTFTKIPMKKIIT